MSKSIANHKRQLRNQLLNQKLILRVFSLWHALDPLGHHALTCKSGGDSISGTTLCVTPSGNRVSWPVLQVK